MRAAEQGFLLLTEQLGDPRCKALSVAQFRTLAMRVMAANRNGDCRELTVEDLMALGYDRAAACHMVTLLSRGQQLESYVNHAAKMDCYPLSRIHPQYPAILRKRLGLDSPGCLWYKGDLSLLSVPKIALVGSRDLRSENAAFAAEAGRQAALQGFALVSGNARGADRIAQESCLNHGGKVICVVADALEKCPLVHSVLYLSQEGIEYPFSAQRAISRNRIIHSLGTSTLVAQCALQKGGTWSGTTANLRHRWSPVFCFDDRSASLEALRALGANKVCLQELQDLNGLQAPEISLF